MRVLTLLFALLLVFAGVVAYDLNRRGLLARETLELVIAQQAPEARHQSPVEPLGLAASIQKKEQKLKEQTEGMQQLAEQLETQRRELATERIALEKRLQELKSISESELKERDEETARLVKMYEGMEPQQAAAVLENLPDAMVAQILLRMRGRQAAQIMDFLSPAKAGDVTKLISLNKSEASS